jgi:hypothetical protein
MPHCICARFVFYRFFSDFALRCHSEQSEESLSIFDLILSDDIPAHPYAVAMEAAKLAPKSEVMFPWKRSKDRIPQTVRPIHSFLRAHHPASVWRSANSATPQRRHSSAGTPACALFLPLIQNSR